MACQAKFGSGARIAATEEIYSSALSSDEQPLASAPPGGSWVTPYGRDGDISGFASQGCFLYRYSGPETSETYTGLVVDGQLRISSVGCTGTRPVACAVPATQTPKFQFAGFSSGAAAGTAGIGPMNALCKEDFGNLARLAYLGEIFNAPGFAPQQGNAWMKNGGQYSEFIRGNGDLCGPPGSQVLSVDGLLRPTGAACPAVLKAACAVPD
jgi:hypothetical protein